MASFNHKGLAFFAKSLVSWGATSNQLKCG